MVVNIVYVRTVRITLQVTAVVGERVTLPCRTSLTTPVDWYYLVSENGRASTICAAGRMVNGYGSRFELQTSHLGDSNLVILNVSREDEGEYICREDAGHGPVHRVKLNVLSKLNTASYLTRTTIVRLHTFGKKGKVHHTPLREPRRVLISLS